MPTRLASLRKLHKDDDFEPDMPDVEAEYLLGYLFEVGPTLLSGMGEAPLTHEELAAWQRNTGIELNTWEARTLLRLSREHMLQSQRSTKSNCEAPWNAESDESKAVVAAQMQRSISELSKL